MIYFDNAATTLHKPPEVADAVARAVRTFGAAGRSFCAPGMDAARAVETARAAVAGLSGVDPSAVAFTSGATESLNLVLQSLVTGQDAVITTVLEHNAVLRPLYQLGCPLSFIPCDEEGRLDLSGLRGLLRRDTRFVVCGHGSNLLGSVADVAALRAFCREHGLTLILDAAQTLGETAVDGNAADVFCFSGHKGLLGPQGTGGIIAGGALPFRPIKTGGTGQDAFAPRQPMRMPDAFEAGTPNAHGLAGLATAALFIEREGVTRIANKLEALTGKFLDGAREIPGITLYGPKSVPGRLPVVALNVRGLASEDVSLRLWEEYGIVTRAGSHCAPLAHRRFCTVRQGMVRFSFGYFNTMEEIGEGLDALRAVARG